MRRASPREIASPSPRPPKRPVSASPAVIRQEHPLALVLRNASTLVGNREPGAVGTAANGNLDGSASVAEGIRDEVAHDLTNPGRIAHG